MSKIITVFETTQKDFEQKVNHYLSEHGGNYKISSSNCYTGFFEVLGQVEGWQAILIKEND